MCFTRQKTFQGVSGSYIVRVQCTEARLLSSEPALPTDSEQDTTEQLLNLMGIASFGIMNQCWGQYGFEVAWFCHPGQSGHRGYCWGGSGGTEPGKWSHAVKPINLLKAARVATCQMKNRSKKQDIVLTLSLGIPVSFSCHVYPKIKAIEKVREIELLQLFPWVQWVEEEQ